MPYKSSSLLDLSLPCFTRFKSSHCCWILWKQMNRTKQTNLVPCKSIKLCYTVTQRTISINNPDLWIWAAELGPQGKAATHPKSPKRTWIQPRQWTSWPEIRKQGYCFTSLLLKGRGNASLFFISPNHLSQEQLADHFSKQLFERSLDG